MIIKMNAENNVNMDPLIRPLVTFAIFAYNQEIYIKEAVESAFAQDYSPLEIIISDDRSSDKTFDIINSLVKNYRGVHHVRAVQTSSNKGTMSHLLSIVGQSNGELIIMAGGDDISYPNRTRTLYDSWSENSAWALHSKFDKINQSGDMLAADCKHETSSYSMRRMFKDESSLQLILGATSAYDRRAFSLVNHECKGIVQEDAVMSFLLHCHGKKIMFVDKSLVKYRSNSGALTNTIYKRFNINQSELINDEEKAKINTLSFINLHTFLLKTIGDLRSSRPILIDSILKSEAENQIRYNLRYNLKFNSMVIEWVDAGFISRLQFLLGSFRWVDIKWISPRLFGLSFFIKTKVFFNKLRR